MLWNHSPRMEPSQSDRMGSASCRQPRIGQTLPADRFDHAVQPLKGVALYVALAQSERELIDIAGEMFRADFVVDAIDAAFQDGPDAFNRVRVSSASRVLASRMIDGIVPEEQAIQPGEDQRFIRVKLSSKFDVLMDALGGFLKAALFHGSGNRAPAALPHPQNGNLADWPASSPQFLVLVLVGFFPADEALVQFHNTPQLRQLWPTARLTKPMQHKPCGRLPDADLLGQLHRRDALASGDQQIHGIEPFVQRNMRPLEHRSGTDGEIQFAGVAAVEPALARGDVPRGFAGWTDRSVRPKARLQKQPRRLGIREHLENLKRANCAFAHVRILDNSLEFVKGLK